MRTKKGASLCASDVKEHDLTQNYYLPGGALETILEKLSSHDVETSKTWCRLGKWNGIELNTIVKLSL